MTSLLALALVSTLTSGPIGFTQTPAGPARPVPPSTPMAPVPTVTTVAPVTPISTADAEDVKRELRQLLQSVPPAVGDVLRLDPSLLTRSDYLLPYPTLHAFVQQHPEIPLNPAFFVGTSWEGPRDAESRGLAMADDVFEGIGVFGGFSLFIGFVVWLVRTVIDHRRWLRQSKVQVDVHAKLLDRLSTHDELLAYVQSPAGRRFLESAPIEVDAPSRPTNAALARVLLAVQAGVVLLALGVGFWVLQSRMGAAGQGFSVLSTITLALGMGFVGAAAASYLISTRHGLIGAEVRAQHE